MRVVLVTPGFPTSLEDHHKPFLLDHALALADAGAEVTVVCPAHPDAPRDGEVGGIEVRRVRFAPARVEARVARGESYRVFAGLSALWVIPMIAGLALAAVREARRRRGDIGVGGKMGAGREDISGDGGSIAVIHGHWWFPCGLVAVAAACASGRRVGSVVHVHGSDAAVTTNAVHRWLARRVLRRAGAVVTVSNRLRDWATSLMPQPSAPDPPPGDTSAERPQRFRSVDSMLPLRKRNRGERTTRGTSPLLEVVSMPVGMDRLGRPTPRPAIGPVLGVGRLMAEKGFDVLIEAVAQMPPAERPTVTIVGDGPDRPLLEALALRRGVNLELPGAVPPTEMGDWYRRARLVCVPSRREGFGMVAAEALMLGRPVVATAVGAAPHFINEGVNGHLVPPDDADALAAALVTALAAALEPRPQSDTPDPADAPDPTPSGPAALALLSPATHANALAAIYANACTAKSAL